MKLDTTFRRAELPQSDNNYDPLPEGWYQSTIMDAQVKMTKSGTGSYIAVRYQINGPTHVGRQLFGNINIRNANPTAENIGHQQLGQLLAAIGVEDLEDTDQLIGGQCSIKLSIRKSEQYGDSNDVKAWKSVEGAKPKPATAAPKSSAPWAKR